MGEQWRNLDWFTKQLPTESGVVAQTAHHELCSSLGLLVLTALNGDLNPTQSRPTLAVEQALVSVVCFLFCLLVFQIEVSVRTRVQKTMRGVLTPDIPACLAEPLLVWERLHVM